MRDENPAPLIIVILIMIVGWYIFSRSDKPDAISKPIEPAFVIPSNWIKQKICKVETRPASSAMAAEYCDEFWVEKKDSNHKGVIYEENGSTFTYQ